MQRTILAGPELGSALAELRGWLGVTRDAENALLSGLLGASCEACEAFTGIVPLALECESILPVVKNWQGIAAQPVQAALGMEGVPADGARFALASDAWATELGADGTACVRVVRPGSAGRVAVRYIAGLAADWESLPAGLKHGILRLAAHHYRSRGNGADGEVAAAPRAAPPAAIAALWRPWRIMRIA
ncbi:hypothetical protein PF049_01335 [Erythrobacteraceae bacterium WH01K]|nr:hypothetical protein PF049_01335 [Erythrobacteraceae bacterium WH01K]